MILRDYKMHGMTPTGRSRSYRYYATIRKVKNLRPAVATAKVEEQIPLLLQNICVSPNVLPQIRALYRQELESLKGPNLKEQIATAHARLEKLKAEEAALARLYAQGKLTDNTYESLYREWQAKVFDSQQEIQRLETSEEEVLDDLDQALILLGCAPQLFLRLSEHEQGRLLQILFRRIVVDREGRIIDIELNPPFLYLRSLGDMSTNDPQDAPPPDSHSAATTHLKSCDHEQCRLELPSELAEQSAKMLCFPQRHKLDKLPSQTVQDVYNASSGFLYQSRE